MKSTALVAAFFLFTVMAACTPGAFAQPRSRPIQGTFRGVVVTPTRSAKSDDGWIYVLGRNRMLRRVSIGNAKVSFAAEVPEHERQGAALANLVEGAEVRVTAKQDGDGNWQALSVEILKLAPPAKPMPPADRI